MVCRLAHCLCIKRIEVAKSPSLRLSFEFARFELCASKLYDLKIQFLLILW